MDYWKEHFNENAAKFENSLFKQVDMTVNGKEADDIQLDLRVKCIMDNLSLKSSDILLDICCGNGLITSKLASHVSYIYAVDFSEGLINIASSINKKQNINYTTGNIVSVNYFQFKNVNKICMPSCFQYLSMDDAKVFMKNLSVLDDISIYISNIPDKEKIWDYYDTDEKKAFYFQREKEGKPHMGTWWNKKDIEKLVSDNGFRCKFLDIDKGLNTSYYRFDVLLNK